MEIVGTTATITAHFELLDPGYSFTAHQATLFLLEDDIFWCCGYGGVDTWEAVARMARSTPIQLTFQGDQETVVEVKDITGFNPANLRAFAIFEEIAGGLEVIQATDFTPVDNFFVAACPNKVESVPDGNDTVLFDAFIQNLGQSAETIDLSMDGAFGWPAEFQIEGDPNWYTTTSTSLAADETKAVTIRVQTDAVTRIGSGTLTAVSQATAQTHLVTTTIFNGSPAILVVDDDGVNTYEDTFTNALTAGGYLFQEFTVGNGGTGPSASALSGYDGVIWQTAYGSATLVAGEIAQLQTYLDNGGRLFLSSMDFLSQNGTNPFTATYLGVDSYVVNRQATSIDGVDGDPISDGMSFPTLFWPTGSNNRPDVVNPGATANTIFTRQTGEPVALRNEFTSGRGSLVRTVFNTVQMDAFQNTGADPNNAKTIILNTMAWLLGDLDPADVGDASLPAVSVMMDASPNPFTPATELRFALSASAAAEPVTLVVVDAGGRQVKDLVNGRLEAGAHAVTWNGRDDLGHEAPNGIYFAVLRSKDGEMNTKLVRIQ
jgi:flagellar hook assembly protein FlgD